MENIFPLSKNCCNISQFPIVRYIPSTQWKIIQVSYKFQYFVTNSNSILVPTESIPGALFIFNLFNFALTMQSTSNR